MGKHGVMEQQARNSVCTMTVGTGWETVWCLSTHSIVISSAPGKRGQEDLMPGFQKRIDKSITSNNSLSSLMNKSVA